MLNTAKLAPAPGFAPLRARESAALDARGCAYLDWAVCASIGVANNTTDTDRALDVVASFGETR